MNSKKLFSTLLVALFLIGNIFAQELITAKDFVELQKENPNVVLIDASKDKLYTQAHVDGAINIPYAELNDNNSDISGLLLPVDQVAEFLGKKGVAADDTIVVYDEGSQKYSTRVYWVLKYLGATNVKLMHKNMNDFRKARVKLTSAVPSVTAKTFNVTLNNDVFADAAYVESMLNDPNVVLIDARTPGEFDGTYDGNGAYSVGHIPGAVNIPYESIVKGDDHNFICADEFASLAPNVEFTPEKQYIVYCKTGVKGSTMYAFLKNVMGFENVKMFEGSYLEWAALNKPIEK